MDLASRLGKNGIDNLLEIMCEAYEAANAKRLFLIDMSEPEMTEEWYIQIMKIWRVKGDSSLIPCYEKTEVKKHKVGRSPAIDFCFRDEFARYSYFGAECKILHSKQDNLFEEYVKEGVNRYLSGKYSRECSVGTMVGYVIDGNIATVVQKVYLRVKGMKNHPSLDQSVPIGSFTEHYESTHIRVKGHSPFSIHHLFFEVNAA